MLEKEWELFPNRDYPAAVQTVWYFTEFQKIFYN